jgi:hypothetical protein
VPPEFKVPQEIMVPQVQLVYKDHKDHKAPLVPQVKMALLACREPLVSQAMWVLLVLLEFKEPPEIMVPRVLQDHKDHKDHKDIKVPQVNLVPQVSREPQVSPAMWVLRVLLVYKVQQA